MHELTGWGESKKPRQNNEDDNLSDEDVFHNEASAESEGETRKEEATQDPPTDEAKEADMEIQRLEEVGSTADQQHDIIESEDNDEEEDNDGKWARQEALVNTTLVVVDRSTSSDTSREPPTSSTITSNTSKHFGKTKLARLHSPPTANCPPFALTITNYFNKVEPVKKKRAQGQYKPWRSITWDGNE